MGWITQLASVPSHFLPLVHQSAFYHESTYLQDTQSVPFNFVECKLLNNPEAYHRRGLPAKAGQGSTRTFLSVTQNSSGSAPPKGKSDSGIEHMPFLLLQVESKRQESVGWEMKVRRSCLKFIINKIFVSRTGLESSKWAKGTPLETITVTFSGNHDVKIFSHFCKMIGVQRKGWSSE